MSAAEIDHSGGPHVLLRGYLCDAIEFGLCPHGGLPVLMTLRCDLGVEVDRDRMVQLFRE